MTKPEFPTADISKLRQWTLIPDKAPGRVLCRRYPKEEKIGSLIRPDRYRENPCGLAWIVKIAADAHGANGVCNTFLPGDTLFIPERVIEQGVIDGIDEEDVYFYLNTIGEAVMHWPAPKEK